MTGLALPDVRLHASWADAVLDFGDEMVHGSGLWHLPEDRRSDVTEEGCRYLVAELSRFADPATRGPDLGFPQNR